MMAVKETQKGAGESLETKEDMEYEAGDARTTTKDDTASPPRLPTPTAKDPYAGASQASVEIGRPERQLSVGSEQSLGPVRKGVILLKYVQGVVASCDKGSCARKNLVAWTAPRRYFKRGWHVFGHHYSDSVKKPQWVLVAKDYTGHMALAPISGWKKCWHDKGSWSTNDYGFFIPTTPPGYVSMGGVFCSSRERDRNGKPYSNADDVPPYSKTQFACIQEEYVQYCGSVSDLKVVWTDSGTGAKMDLSIGLSENLDRGRMLPVKSGLDRSGLTQYYRFIESLVDWQVKRDNQTVVELYDV